jgi:DNA-binding CsgD family transcriptional regulator/tetratricopeptide (TPR) repeat protein
MKQIAEAFEGERRPAFVVAGPAGVGKSRLATETAGLAAARGYAVSRVVGTKAAASIPLGAFAPLLPTIEPSSAGPLGLLQRAGDLLLNTSGKGGELLLVVDDAQLLDEGSAALVHQLVVARSCAVIVTVRVSEPIPDTVTTLWKDDLASRLDLGPLTEAEVADLAQGALGGPLTGASIRWLSKSSAGNPLYARELLIGALESGALSDQAGIWSLAVPMPPPDRLAELIAARLANQPKDVGELLDLLALAESLGFAILESVVGSNALERAETDGLVVARHVGDRIPVQLGHPLYGEVIRHRMPVARRRRLCGTLAALIQQAGARRHDDILRVAQWQLEADDRPDPGVLEEAARAAKGMYDLDLASRLARAALDAGAGAGAGLVLGEAEFFRGNHEAAETVMAAVWGRCQNDEEKAAIASARAYNLGFLMNLKDRAVAVVDEALLEVTAPGPRLRLVARLATTRLFAGEMAEALADADQLIDSGDDNLVHRGAIVRAEALAFLGRTGEALATAQMGLEAQKRSTDQSHLPAVQLIGAVLGHAAGGDLTSAAADANAAYEDCLEANDEEGVATFALLRGLVNIEMGHLNAAAKLFREGVSINRQINDPSVLRWCLGGVALAEGMAGNAADARAAVAELDATPEHWMTLFSPDLIDRGRAWALVADGEISTGADRLIQSAAQAAGSGHRIAEARLLHDAARLGQARTVAGRLRDLAMEVDGDLVPAMADHAEALAGGDGDELVAVSERFEVMACWLLAAETLATARQVFESDGLERKANAAARRSAELLERCGPVKTPALAVRTAARRLTRREREVAALAASGASSREIADRLFVSERTVENHLQHAYEKLGISGRNELKAVLADP